MSALSKSTQFPLYKSEFCPVGGTLKRSFDIVFSAGVVLISTPILLILVLLIKLNSPGPGLYVHRRIGLNGREFGCLKLRTMHVDSDARLKDLLAHDPSAAREFDATAKLRSDPRIIPGIGRLLRQTSLDELPQFLNVLKGDMSVIGPRPVTRDELDRHYGTRTGDVLSARPGISGLWQVSGRSGLSYAERVRLDLEYVRGWRFTGDLSILLRTIGVVVLGKGAC
jgi:exopolysaccharide production protein ExoY